jgi:hypothetical protein
VHLINVFLLLISMRIERMSGFPAMHFQGLKVLEHSYAK